MFESLSKNKGFGQNFPKINKRAGWNKAVQDGIFQKINKVCCTIIRQAKVCKLNWVKIHTFLTVTQQLRGFMT